MRTFIAIDTPISVKQQILKIQSELQKSNADVKWEPLSKFHITIKFLGEVSDTKIENIYHTVQQTAEENSTFSLKYKGLGCFPNSKQPRVIWVGCQDLNGILSKIKDSLDERLKEFGYEIEDRKFHPHITLGRVKSPKNIKNLLPIIENLNFESETIECREILVMKSDLKPTGSEYSTLKIINLRTSS